MITTSTTTNANTSVTPRPSFSHETIPVWWQTNAGILLERLLSPENGMAGDFQELVISAVARGRLLRGSLALQMPRWLGLASHIADNTRLISLLTQVEIVHSAACIFDDIIDRDTYRRGVASFPIRSGLPAAVLTALHMISRACQEEARLLEPHNWRLQKAFDSMIIGEAHDVIPGFRKISSQSVLLRVLEKTTPLFGAAFWYAGLLTHDLQNDSATNAENFGKHLGVIYQMANDFHDVFSIGPMARGEQDDETVISWSLPVHCAVSLGVFDPREVGRTLTRRQLQALYDSWQLLGVQTKAHEALSAAKTDGYAAFPAQVPAELREVVELITSASFWAYSYGE